MTEKNLSREHSKSSLKKKVQVYINVYSHKQNKRLGKHTEILTILVALEEECFILKFPVLFVFHDIMMSFNLEVKVFQTQLQKSPPYVKIKPFLNPCSQNREGYANHECSSSEPRCPVRIASWAFA